MTRRDYVSFLRERRRGHGYYDGGPDPARWLWPIAALALIAVSVWWFGFRDADQEAIAERVLQDTTIPSVLLPVGDAEAGAEVAGASVECLAVVEEWTTFQGGIERHGCTSARRVETPRIQWQTEIGISGWLNNPVIEDGVVYVGSAGEVQFTSDRLDGIYSLVLATGELRWRYSTELDVNAVSVSNGVVVATGDEGRVWAIDGGSGDLLWTDDLQVAVFGSPLIVDDLVVIGAGDGSIIAYELAGRNGGAAVRWRQSVPGPVRGGPASDGDHIYIAGETHQVLALDLDGTQLWRSDVLARGSGSEDSRIFSTPTITDDLVIVTFVRSDVFAEPAIMALDKATGDEVWRSQDTASLKFEWANVRSSPAVAGEYLVYAEGYSNLLTLIDLETGNTVRSIETGPLCFPHWPSVAVNNGYAYVARHDGGLYAVDLEAQDSELAWEIYLGVAGGTGAFPEDHACEWGPETGFSILASPAVSPEGLIVVGTLEGRLLAIGDRDW